MLSREFICIPDRFASYKGNSTQQLISVLHKLCNCERRNRLWDRARCPRAEFPARSGHFIGQVSPAKKGGKLFRPGGPEYPPVLPPPIHTRPETPHIGK